VWKIFKSQCQTVTIDEHKNLLKWEYLQQGPVKIYIWTLIFKSVKKKSRKCSKRLFYSFILCTLIYTNSDNFFYLNLAPHVNTEGQEVLISKIAYCNNRHISQS